MHMQYVGREGSWHLLIRLDVQVQNGVIDMVLPSQISHLLLCSSVCWSWSLSSIRTSHHVLGSSPRIFNNYEQSKRRWLAFSKKCIPCGSIWSLANIYSPFLWSFSNVYVIGKLTHWHQFRTDGCNNKHIKTLKFSFHIAKLKCRKTSLSWKKYIYHILLMWMK